MDIIRIPVGFVNVYLLINAGKAIIVDTGLGDALPKMLEGLKAHGLKMDDVTLVVLSHGHADHDSNAQPLKEKYGRKTAKSPANKGALGMMKARTLFGRIIKLFSAQKTAPFNDIDYWLKEGQTLAEFGFPQLHVVAAPGHTVDSICLLDESGNMIAGDMFMNFGGIPALAHICEDEDALNKSFEKIIGLAPKKVYPGHGPSFDFPRFARDKQPTKKPGFA